MSNLDLHPMNCPVCDEPGFLILGRFYELSYIGFWKQDSVHPVTAEFDEHECERDESRDDD